MSEFFRKWGFALFGAALFAISLALLVSLSGILTVFPAIGLFLGAAIFIEGARAAKEQPVDGMVTLTATHISYEGQSGTTHQIALNDLCEIKIQTTSDGPVIADVFWLFETQAGDTLKIPSTAGDFSDVFKVLETLENVDWGAVILSSGSLEDAEFLVWQRA